jgi:hypothetical protein
MTKESGSLIGQNTRSVMKPWPWHMCVATGLLCASVTAAAQSLLIISPAVPTEADSVSVDLYRPGGYCAFTPGAAPVYTTTVNGFVISVTRILPDTGWFNLPGLPCRETVILGRLSKGAYRLSWSQTAFGHVALDAVLDITVTGTAAGIPTLSTTALAALVVALLLAVGVNSHLIRRKT